MKNKLLVGITGSFCNHKIVLQQLSEIRNDYEISFVFTKNVSTLDTRFSSAIDLKKECEKITSEPIIQTICDAEKIGPNNEYDMMAILPCTANSLSRLVHGAYDCPVSLCAKAMIRNNKNVLIGISSNDILGISGVNLMKAMNMKNIYVLPFYQDDPLHKSNSCTSMYSELENALKNMILNKQIQPIIREKKQ